MTNLLEGAELTLTEEPTDEELLEEARAWGFQTVDELWEHMDKAHQLLQELLDEFGG